MKYNHIRTITTAIMSLLTVAAFSIPAKRVWRTAQLANGTAIEVMLVGDENGHWYIDKDGKALAKDKEGKLYYLTTEQAEARKSTRIQRVNKNNARRTSQRKSCQAETSNGKKKTFGVPTTLIGEKRGLVILVNFSDKAFLPKNTQDVFNERFNKEGYNAPGYIGSVHDYFHDQSYGLFDLSFDVIGPVTVSKPHSYYGSNDDYGDDLHPCELVIEALKLVDNTVNFADYDWDGDGEVDQVFIIYAGTGEASSDIADDIWPHEWVLSEGQARGDGSGAQVMDGVKIDTYAMSCELGDAQTIDGIGTACHEFSHCLGYADLYDTDYSGGQGMMSWDLMDSGSYNGPNNLGEVPAAFTSFERWWAGWLDFTELTSPTYITDMPALNDKPVAYKITNDAHRDEYYILENRQAKRWDKYTAGNGNGTGHGMLILHVDYDKATWQENAPNDIASRQRMTYFAADNSYGTLVSLGSGMKAYSATYAQLAGDPFPGTSGNTAFTDDTRPAATLYNANVDGSRYMHKPVTDITESSDGLISFTFMGGIPVPAISDVKNITSNSFTATWSEVKGADSYTLKAYPYTTPAIEGATLLSTTFSYDVTSDGNTDISSKMTDDWSGAKLYESPYGIKIGNSKNVAHYIMTPTVSPASGHITIYTETKQYSQDSKNIIAYLADPDTKQTLTRTDGTFYAKDFTTDTEMKSSAVSMDYGNPCRIMIEPSKRIYLKKITVYDGDFTLEEIMEASSSKAMPVLASATESDGTIIIEGITDCHYTLTGLTAPQYRFMVKATVDGKDSNWSTAKTVTLAGTGITSILTGDNTAGHSYYSIDGRNLGTDKSQLKPGIYLFDKKKVIINK